MGDFFDIILARRLADVDYATAVFNLAPSTGRTTVRVKPPEGYIKSIIFTIRPAVPLPEDVGQPISRAASLTTTLTTYSDVLTWRVSPNRSGALAEVSLDSNNLVLTNWRLLIADNEQWTNFNPRRALSIPFPPRNQLPEQATVVLQAASTDGTSIIAYGSIVGKEYPTHVFEMGISGGKGIVAQTVLCTGDIIRNGLNLWLPISSDSPLEIYVNNANGFGNERFIATIGRLNIINEFADTLIQSLTSLWGIRNGVGSLPSLQRAQ